MKFSRALLASCLASVSHAWGFEVERPNADHPGTRDIIFTYPGADEEKLPKLVAVPSFIPLDQVHCVEVAGRFTSFTNGEAWLVLGQTRVIQFSEGVSGEDWEFEKGHDPAEFPLITPEDNLDALLEEFGPLDEVRAIAAERQRSNTERPLMQVKRILMHGCAVCSCTEPFSSNGVC
ncbi:hypothetical protein PWT90_04989 [Aphanocladium album]|nr:hypothetical protein PWT90_04989 [Aphanocladium album]